MITLALDASTYAGDVALLVDGRVAAEAVVAMKGADEERLMPAVAEVLARAAVRVDAIDRVVCGAGPGSFTSLRIAGAIAKGLASGVGRPLFAAPSLALLVAETARPAGRYVAALDALRGEHYVALYLVDDDGTVSELERARVVPTSDVPAIAAAHDGLVSPTAFAGAVIASPRARGVSRLERLLDRDGPVDLAAWEPAYGRLAEAQVRWEAAHGRALSAG